jgi:cell division protein FtsX
VTLRWLGRRVGRHLRQSPLFLLALTAAFAVVAALAAAANTLGHESERATARLASNVHVVAYLDAGLPDDRAAALVIAFGRLGGVVAARAIDGKAALSELKTTLNAVGERDDVLAGIEAEFLPRSIEITLAPGHDLTGRAREVAARLGRLEGVSAVDAMTDGLGRVAAFGALAGRLAALFAGVAALAGLALLGGLVLRERTVQQELAETMHLLGATSLATWLPGGLLDAAAAMVGGSTGFLLGAWLAALALGMADPLRASALPVGHLLITLVVLAGAGLGTGWLSLPRPRGLVARSR